MERKRISQARAKNIDKSQENKVSLCVLQLYYGVFFLLKRPMSSVAVLSGIAAGGDYIGAALQISLEILQT